MPGMPPYGEFIFGHEYAGDVVAIGRTVDEFQVGDRVVVEAHMGCRRCENCIRGHYTACLNYGNLGADIGPTASPRTAGWPSTR